MSVFRWTAPLCRLASRRWSEDDFLVLADRLRPYVPPAGILADLGGGTGELGTGVARVLKARVVVIDPVRQMLQKVRATPLVSVRLAAAEALPFPTAYFDALLCSDAFHHFRDQEKAVTEMARVVRTGGGVLILDPEPTRLYRAVALGERLLGEPGALRTAEETEALMAAHGVYGRAHRQRGGSYLFVGEVRRNDG